MEPREIIQLGVLAAGIVAAWAVMRYQVSRLEEDSKQLRADLKEAFKNLENRLSEPVRKVARNLEEHIREDGEAHERISALEAKMLDGDVIARKDRVEAIAARVHKLASFESAVSLLHAKVGEMDKNIEKHKSESGDLRVQVAALTATVRESGTRMDARLDDIADRIDRNEASSISRLDAWKASLDSMITRIVTGKDIR